MRRLEQTLGQRSSRFLVCVFGVLALWAFGATLDLSPFWCVLTIASLDLLLFGSKGTERLLVASAALVGLVPMFGWFAIPAGVNPVLIVAGVWAGTMLCSDNPSPIRALGGAAGCFVPILGSLLSYQWWRDIARGSADAVLERVLPIWDFAGHFDLFLSAIVNSKYKFFQRDYGGDLDWIAREYPAGIHYVWAQFAAPDKAAIVASPPDAIPMFISYSVITLCICICIVGIALGRLGRNWTERFSFSAVATGLAVGFIALGPLSQSLQLGFVNMPVVLIASAILISFFLKPAENRGIQITVLVATAGCLAYNWYPLLLLFLPAIAREAWSVYRSDKRLGIVFCLSFFGVITPPILQTFSLGVSHLEVDGGIQPFPSGLLVILLCTSIVLGLLTLRRSHLGRIPYLALTPICLIGGLGVKLRLSTGRYPYYFHKLSLIVAFIVAMIILGALATIWIQLKDLGLVGVRSSREFFASCLLAFGSTFGFGYWGFEYPAFSGGGIAIGVLVRNDLVYGAAEYTATSKVIIQEAIKAKGLPATDRSCLTLLLDQQSGMSVDAPSPAWKFVTSNYWFHALTDSYTRRAWSQAALAAGLAGHDGTSEALANRISELFDANEVCVLSTKSVNRLLQDRGPQWKTVDIGGT